VILDAVAASDGHQEMADELGITHAAVKQRLARMRETFAERVEKEGMSHRKREKGGRPLATIGGDLRSFAHDFAMIAHDSRSFAGDFAKVGPELARAWSDFRSIARK
jgi:predicted transcriptional regulator